MRLHVAVSVETFVTQWAHVWFSSVDSHVSLPMWIPTWHLYGLSPLWILQCLSRLVDVVNAFTHTWHLYGFPPLWILACTTRPPDVVNRLLQTVHSNSFSPIWLCLCIVRDLLLLKHLPHSVQLYLSVWIFIWVCRLSRDESFFPHWLHEYTFLPLCLLLWTLTLHFEANCLWQTVHKYCLDLSSCGLWVISLLSASVFTSKELPVYSQMYTYTHTHTHKCTKWKTI